MSHLTMMTDKDGSFRCIVQDGDGLTVVRTVARKTRVWIKRPGETEIVETCETADAAQERALRVCQDVVDREALRDETTAALSAGVDGAAPAAGVLVESVDDAS